MPLLTIVDPKKKVFYRRTVPGDVASLYFATRTTFYIAHTLYKTYVYVKRGLLSLEF